MQLIRVDSPSIPVYITRTSTGSLVVGSLVVGFAPAAQYLPFSSGAVRVSPDSLCDTV